AEVVALHRGDPTALRAWQYIVDESRNHYLPIYLRLGVGLTLADERGESFYNDRLAGLVAELEKRFGPTPPAASPAPFSPGSPRIRVEESDGALCIFHETPDGRPMFKNPEGKPLPMIIRKSDGAFLYATTDLAAMRFRTREMHADRIVYVTDARQARHFEMVFAAARAIGWTRRANQPDVQLEHASFGSILGEDRKPLKTRSGENIKLSDLLDEAVSRAEQLIRTTESDPDRRRDFTESEIRDIAEAVGIGAVKYADLAQNRQSDYVFSWDRMLALEGNTAPYLMYAYARIRSIYRKGAESGDALAAAPAAGAVVITGQAERVLALQIARFAETIDDVAANLKINLLTDYLYELSGAFMRFYEACPVLSADTPALRASRLRLCDLTARTLRIGLDLLGIRTLERM
ncbi:MAG TPA: arginine--tRNA ligase, partial [Phycisphaerae bacterium]|nr:arginine--tRNA ligase [Phycisphaerae bacterium]